MPSTSRCRALSAGSLAGLVSEGGQHSAVALVSVDDAVALVRDLWRRR
jgi:hypothetical protein